MKPKSGFKYRPEVDGLRAIAVVPVILFHAGFAWMSGGYVGVDIFFVISGYLITSIIVNELKSDSFSIVRFYERRARRILPALFFVLLVCLPFAFFWMTPDLFKEFSHSLTAVALFGSNILFWRTSGYFDVSAELKPLLHTWSLGVEEQYYLAFPILMAACWRFGRKNLTVGIAVVGVASLALSEFAWRSGRASAGFYLIPTRTWELMIGSLVALTSHFGSLPERMSPRLNNVLSALGFVLMAGAIVLYDSSTPFPSLYALAPTVGAALILVFAVENTFAAKLLSLRGMVGIGLISYSAYLWHYPIFALHRIRFAGHTDSAVAIGLIGLCFLLAYFSWRFVETPFRTPHLIGRRSIFAGSAIGLVVLCTVGYAGHLTDGFRNAYIARLSEAERERFRAIEIAIVSPPSEDGNCKFMEDNVTPAFESRFYTCVAKYRSAILVLGDSHAADLFNVVSINTEQPFLVGISKGGCRPHSPDPTCQYENAAEFIEKHKNEISKILYNQKGSYFLTDYKDLPINDDFIKKTQEYVERISTFVPVTWFGPKAEPNIDLLLIHGQLKDIPADGARLETVNIEAVDRRLDEVQKGRRYKYISTYQLVGYNFTRDFIVDGKITYSDKDHWSSFGEQLFGRRLLTNPLVEAALR